GNLIRFIRRIGTHGTGLCCPVFMESLPDSRTNHGSHGDCLIGSVFSGKWSCQQRDARLACPTRSLAPCNRSHFVDRIFASTGVRLAGYREDYPAATLFPIDPCCDACVADQWCKPDLSAAQQCRRSMADPVWASIGTETRFAADSAEPWRL